MQINSLGDKIRQHTASSHQALEKAIIQQIRRINSIEDYKQLLILFYGFYKPLEQKIQQHINKEDLPGAVRQAVLLEEDFRQLQCTYANIESCRNLPSIQNSLQALASLYVLEGSTLGGKYILQMIRKKIDLNNGYGDLFFTGHGEQTAERWERFKTYLEDNVSTEQLPLFLESVTETFERFQHWAALNYQYDEQHKL